ncbi:hypothetical protein F4804DRAFT_335433 [Jackrogersella minutella]|nr:hypothetical protein F4804DRAFT_335433 [Jackrogersella minutella]
MITTVGGKEIWYRDVYSAEDLWFISRTTQENVDEGGSPGGSGADTQTDIRVAMLSGKCESPYSVPVSVADIRGIVDETHDEDYVEDSEGENEKLEGWDSSNEETEDGSDTAPGERPRGFPRWDSYSSAETSQALSSTS